MGRKGYKCIITNSRTGKQYEFPTGVAASKFLGRHKNYITDCRNKDCEIKDAHTGDVFTCEYVNYKKPQRRIESMQICCFCKKACGGCSWSRNFEPVKGWEARPTIINHGFANGKKRECHSYKIISCPEYEKG